MTEAVILSTVEKLESLQVETAAVGAEEKVQVLIDVLRSTLPLLKYFDLRANEFNLYRAPDFVDRLRRTVHDADMTVDMLIFNLEHPIKRRGPLRWFARGEQPYFYNIFCRDIEPIIRQAKENNSRHGIDLTKEEEEPRMRTTTNRVTEPYWVVKSEVVGLKKDIEVVLQRVLISKDAAAEQGLSTLCIVGMGGVGKSTLAALLYYNDYVAYNFRHRGWLCLSSHSTPKEALKRLMTDLGIHREKTAALDDVDGLRNLLLQHLQGKRYFIVLDDVWRDSNIEFFLSCFPNHDAPSRLLVTSRSRDIIGHAQYIHEMNVLDHRESWQLFLKEIFKDKHAKCPNNLKKIGRKILTKCNGLPLAITVVGRQLSEKEQSERAWEWFLETMDFSFVSQVLELSYQKFSPELKSCFLRLSFFKEGATIRADKLIQVWAAGGLLSRRDGYNDMDEEIGRKYLYQLINDCTVQVKDMSRIYNRVKNCHMNDNLYRLAVSKAEEEISFEVVMCYYFINVPRRHRVIYCSREAFNLSTYRDRHLVSLFFRGGGHFHADHYGLCRLILLKILDFEGFGLKTLSESVGDLISLRYLGLRNNFLQELPCSLGRLKRLEVLDIAQNFKLHVPNVIWEMDSLRHFYMSDIICRRPFKIDALRNIRTLSYISVDDWKHKLSGLQTMNSLRKLGVEKVDAALDMRDIFLSLAKLKNLDCLILRGSRFRSMPSLDELGQLYGLTQLKLDGLLPRLPRANNFPPNIRYLTLINTSLDEDPTTVLEKLPELVFLKLKNAFTGKQMTASHFMFAELNVLCIEDLWHLRNLKVGEGAMRKLKALEINNCPYLVNLEELKKLTTKNER